MCGIAGMFSMSNEDVSLDILKLMTDAIKHRGPDGEGHYINTNKVVGLGHRRLAIIDLSNAGKQPMQSKCGRFTITFNGEIYNYLELKNELENKGVKFISCSDTEVLLELFILEGKHCLKKLNGMFAFAIWDEIDEQLFCARDRFGEKPFYYSVNNNTFYFASEMKALWAAGVAKNIREEALYDYLVFGIVEHPDERELTFYQNISKLDAAHSLIVTTNGQLLIENYWNMDEIETNNDITLDEAKSKFLSLLTDSVAIRLRSDVSVGSSFSGGLDSSTIVCLINAIKQSNNQQKQKTFSARFKNFKKDEGKFIEIVSNVIDAENIATWPDADKLIQDFSKLCYHQEEPFGSASIFAQWEVMKIAKENHVTVLLDGQGADEQLAGYSFYINEYYRSLKKNSRSLFNEEVKSYYKSNGVHWNKPFRIKLLKEYPKFHQRLSNLKALFKEDQVAKCLSKPFLDRYRLRKKPIRKTNNLKDSLKFSLLKGELQELLRYADRNSMAFSREIRLPFLDHNLVEFTMSLPESFLIRNGYTKYLLRIAVNQLVPDEIIWRTDKVAFETPQQEWSLRFNELSLFCNQNSYFSADLLNTAFNISCETLFLPR